MYHNPLVVWAHPELIKWLPYGTILFTKSKGNGYGKTIIDTDGWATGDDIGKWLSLIVNAICIIEYTPGYNAATKRYWLLFSYTFQVLSIQVLKAQKTTKKNKAYSAKFIY